MHPPVHPPLLYYHSSIHIHAPLHPLCNPLLLSLLVLGLHECVGHLTPAEVRQLVLAYVVQQLLLVLSWKGRCLPGWDCGPWSDAKGGVGAHRSVDLLIDHGNRRHRKPTFRSLNTTHHPTNNAYLEQLGGGPGLGVEEDADDVLPQLAEGPVHRQDQEELRAGLRSVFGLVVLFGVVVGFEMGQAVFGM